MQKFLALYDLHWGNERRSGHKIPLHDQKALNVALEFADDFHPDHVILGGDILDCGCISHHNHGKPGAVEGLRLLSDAKELQAALIEPLEALKAKSYTYIIGNHEDWLSDLSNQIPALEDLIDLKTILDLDGKWKIVPNGESHKLGKLVFIHGDQVKGGEHSAKWATIAYEANVRLGHYHTFQVYSKTSALESTGHTGIVIPCLCRKNPLYGGGSPNKWMQGFSYGYVDPATGCFADYFPIIINGQSIINGKLYKG